MIKVGEAEAEAGVWRGILFSTSDLMVNSIKLSSCCPNLSVPGPLVGFFILGWLLEMSDSEEHHFESKADAGASKT
uniref:Uncharacterized protein n=1 Tax=Oryza brachyantha TaxID=4533 RepID=J3MI45_ORYBR